MRIFSETPFRISFFGGGTDYPAWVKEHGGVVLSTTIDQYCYITCRYLPPFFDYTIKLVYSEIERVKNIDEIKHPSAQEVLRFFNLNNVEIHYDADIPKSGMGSSSAGTVGLLNTLYAFTGKNVSKEQLARDAIHIEQNILHENVGSQDQVAAAYGGFNKIEFGIDGSITVTPVNITPERCKSLQDHLLLFFTGRTRIASEVAAEQIKNIPQRTAELCTMKEMAREAINILESNRSFNDFGLLLHEGWKLKKSLSSRITTPEIDAIYEAALEHGAYGGKVLGAGGGGSVVFFVPPERQREIINVLQEKHEKLIHIPFQFEDKGSVVYVH